MNDLIGSLDGSVRFAVDACLIAAAFCLAAAVAIAIWGALRPSLAFSLFAIATLLVELT